MPSWDENLYYNPSENGFDLIAALDFREPNWSFDLFIVLYERATSKVYIATDSGCSCPTPFEDHTFPTDFTEVRSWQEVKDNYPADGYTDINLARDKIVGALRRGA